MNKKFPWLLACSVSIFITSLVFFSIGRLSIKCPMMPFPSDNTQYIVHIPADSCAWQNPIHEFRDGPPAITIHRDTTDLGLINALRTKPLYNRWTFHTVDHDSLVMHSWFFDSGYQVFIQIAGHVPDTTVFVRYKKAAVCVTPAVEALVKRKLLKP